MIPLINVMNFTSLAEQRLAILLSGVFRLAFQPPEVTINNATRQLGDILLRAAANREEIRAVMEKNGGVLPGRDEKKKERETTVKEEARVIVSRTVSVFKMRYFVDVPKRLICRA